MLFYVDTRNFLKAIRGNRYRLVPKGGTFPIETIMLVVRSSGSEKLKPKPAQMGQNFHHSMLMPLHDSMPSFMNFRRVLGFTIILKPGISMFCRQSTMRWCLKFIPFSCMGPKNASKDTDLIF